MLRLGIAIVVTAVVAAFAAVRAAAEPPQSGQPTRTTECRHGGFADLFAQDGSGTAATPSSTFARQGDCMKWLLDGGTVGMLRPELRSEGGVMSLWLTISGAAPAGITGLCAFEPDLPTLVYFALSFTGGSGPGGSGCLSPSVYGEPFELLQGPCSAGGSGEVTVLMATASGGVVGRTVKAVCAA
jgi:hypothetical protein